MYEQELFDVFILVFTRESIYAKILGECVIQTQIGNLLKEKHLAIFTNNKAKEQAKKLNTVCNYKLCQKVIRKTVSLYMGSTN